MKIRFHTWTHRYVNGESFALREHLAYAFLFVVLLSGVLAPIVFVLTNSPTFLILAAFLVGAAALLVFQAGVKHRTRPAKADNTNC